MSEAAEIKIVKQKECMTSWAATELLTSLAVTWGTDEIIRVKKYFERIIGKPSVILFVFKEFWNAVKIYIGGNGHSLQMWKQM